MTTFDQTTINPDLHTVQMKAAADARGLPNHYVNLSIDKNLQTVKPWLRFEVNQKAFYYAKGSLLEADADRWGRAGRNVNHKAMILVADKFSTKTHLKQLGFSVPEGRFFRRRHLEEAINAYDAFRKPICVKPNKGSEGRKVFPALCDRAWYEYALRKVAEVEPNILVEESMSGAHYRFFYVYPNVVGIRLGERLHVIGDGVSSIKNLLEDKNKQRRRKNIPTHPPYEIDQVLLDFLAMQGLTPDNIPVPDQKVYLLGVSNGTAGADTIILNAEDAHPSYRTVVEQACQSVPGLHFTGMDLIIQDIRQPAAHDNHWILEANASPAILPFYYPWNDHVVDIAGFILDFLATNPDFS